MAYLAPFLERLFVFSIIARSSYVNHLFHIHSYFQPFCCNYVITRLIQAPGNIAGLVTFEVFYGENVTGKQLFSHRIPV
jgi:hypothetical protein